MPPMSQLDWLSSTTAMIVVFWSRATRDLLKSFGWGIAALHRLHAATKLPFPRRPPHSISWSRRKKERLYRGLPYGFQHAILPAVVENAPAAKSTRRWKGSRLTIGSAAPRGASR